MEVIAFIGPSGTGKSHRALLVAHRFAVDAIIDDGLLIKGSRILAGFSAKGEKTMVAAVRRATFQDPEYAKQVREKISELNLQRILILGTSKNMVSKICRSLDLPDPSQFITIDEVATPKEIMAAKRIRLAEKKHVVPVVTWEIKKGFTGNLLASWKVWQNRKNGGRETLGENTIVRPAYNYLGAFTISEKALASIVEYVAGRYPGIMHVRCTGVEQGAEGVTVNISVSAELSKDLIDTLTDIQKTVKERLEYCTAFPVQEIVVFLRKVVFHNSGTTFSETESGKY